MIDDEPDLVECMKCGDTMKPVQGNREFGSWDVGYQCENCRAKEVTHYIYPLALLLKQSEELYREYLERRQGING